MKIGAHISTAKPFSECIVRAQSIGCECMQIFANPPQRWNPVAISDTEFARFEKLNQAANINPIIIHGIYLLNLASSNPYFYQQSISSLVDDMKKASRLGATGVNFHVGSTKGDDIQDLMPRVNDAIFQILDQSPEGPSLIIENSAGAGNVIGDTLEEIAEIIDAVKSDRLKVLVDTAHAFESGYDLKTAKGLADFLEQFDRLIGLEKLVGFHLNDSKTALNSKRDRHADIGTGEIGLETFNLIVNHPLLKEKCGILETPQEQTDWITQIKQLKALQQK